MQNVSDVFNEYTKTPFNMSNAAISVLGLSHECLPLLRDLLYVHISACVRNCICMYTLLVCVCECASVCALGLCAYYLRDACAVYT